MNNAEFRIFETGHWDIILSDEQRYLGRSVVVLKRPCGDLALLAPAEVEDFFAIVSRMQALLKKAFGARMFNWSCNMNDAYRNDPPDPQVHWHVIPRYGRPIEFAGEVFEDKNFGRHHLKGGEGDRIVSAELRTAILGALKENL